MTAYFKQGLTGVFPPGAKCLMNVFSIILVTKTQGEGNFNQEFAGVKFTSAENEPCISLFLTLVSRCLGTSKLKAISVVEVKRMLYTPVLAYRIKGS